MNINQLRWFWAIMAILIFVLFIFGVIADEGFEDWFMFSVIMATLFDFEAKRRKE